MTSGPRTRAGSGNAEQDDDYDLDEEVNRLELMLRTRDVYSMDWAGTMACAPIAIGIIGECLILSSHRRATSVSLSDSRLKATTLPANLHHLALTGKSAFSESSSRMRNISSQAMMLCKNGSGVIDNIMKLVCAEPTQVHMRLLERQKKTLKTVVERCTSDAQALQDAFEVWKEETLVLLDALNVSKDLTVKKVDETGANLVNTKDALERLKKELGFDGLNFEEIEERLFERQGLSRATSIVGAPVIGTGMLLTLLGSSLGGPLALGASMAVLGRAAWAGYTQIKRDNQLQELQEKSLKAQNLDQQFQKLNSDSITIKEIESIVVQAIRQIYELQNQIGTLLLFFKSVFNEVESLDKLNTRQLQEDVDDREALQSQLGMEMMKDNALNLKISFTFIGRLASMYSQVSGKYLLPGMHTVQMLGLSDDSVTPAQRDWKKRELEDFKRDAMEGVRRMTMDQQDQLNADMAPLIEQGVLSLRAVTT